MNSVHNEIFDRAKDAILDLDEQTVKTVAQEALDAGIDPDELIEQSFAKGVREIGRIFDVGEFQLRQIFKAYSIAEKGIDVLKPKIMDSEKDAWLFEDIIRESDRTPRYTSIPHVHEASLSSYC
ncbi:B12-binding domain-containing protein [Methanolobus chelungpuianus]|uniref:B12-binding domain-containing protein n=1 Tax=Methanolobus chelungpuianus TaxID=502115 RepID=UPI002114CE91|nr:B12-binding domain-containing protein [Methanolobus chelungpuianus]